MIVHVGQIVEDDRRGRVEEAPLALSEGRLERLAVLPEQVGGAVQLAQRQRLGPFQAEQIEGRRGACEPGVGRVFGRGMDHAGDDQRLGDGLLGRGVEAPQAPRLGNAFGLAEQSGIGLQQAGLARAQGLHQSERGVAAHARAGVGCGLADEHNPSMAQRRGAAQHNSASINILWHYTAPGQPGRPTGFIGLSRRKPLKSAESSTKVTKSG